MKLPLAILLACAAAQAQTQATIPNAEEWQELHRVASELRGLEFEHPVEMRVEPYEKYRSGVEFAVNLLPGGRLSALKKLGLYAPEVDERGALLALAEATKPASYQFGAHVVAWVDRTGRQERNLRVMGIDMLLHLLDSRIELSLGCHELVHALQDQHFENLMRLDRRGDSDHQLAVQSLYEGDANLVQYEYVARAGGKQAKDLFHQVGDLPFDSSAFYGCQPIDASPRFLRDGVSFPYTCGVGFVLAVRERGGWAAVDKAYSDPPQSSEQILHPEKYLDVRDDPVAVTLPDLSQLLPGWKPVYEEVVGEQNLRVMMRETHPGFDERVEGAACAGWGGDRYALLAAEGKEPLLVWATVWDSEADAREFFEAYRWTLCHKHQEDGSWGDIEEARKFVGVTRGRGVVVVMRTGKDVLIVEGLETENVPLLETIDASIRKVTPRPK